MQIYLSRLNLAKPAKLNIFKTPASGDTFGKAHIGAPRPGGKYPCCRYWWKVPVLYGTGVKVPLPTELVEKASICWRHWQLSVPLTERKKARA